MRDIVWALVFVLLFITIAFISSSSEVKHQNNSFMNECLSIKKLFIYSNKDKCVNRTLHNNYLSCLLSIAPSEASFPHILIIGSSKTLGRSFATECKKKWYRVVEIPSQSFMNLSSDVTYEILKQVNYYVAFNFMAEETRNITSLNEFLGSLNIPVYYQTNDSSENIPSFALPLTVTGEIIDDSLINDMIYSCTSDNISSLMKAKNVVKSDVVAKKIIKVIERYLDERTNDYPKSVLIKAAIGDFDIMKNIESMLSSCNNGTKTANASQINNVTAQSFAKMLFNESSNVYASLVFSSDASERILPRINIVFEFLDMYFEKYPAAPIEIVHVFENNPEQKNRPNVGDFLRNHLRVIDIPEEKVRKIKEENNIDYFPEFILKNIGIRRSHGEYIVCCNADTIPPASFLEAARKKELSPFALIRTKFVEKKREYISKNQNLRNLLNPRQVEHVLYNWNNPTRTLNTAFQKQGSGNFQGCHRRIWERFGGYAEGPWVFHVDTAMMLEFSALTELTYVSKYIGSVHVEHKPVSKETQHFPDIKAMQQKAPCLGESPKKITGIAKKDWGLPDVVFNISNSY